MAYEWQPKDDLIALLLLKINPPNSIIEKVAQEMGCPSNSLKMRIKNLEFLKNGSGGLDHVAKQTEDIFNKFCSIL